MVKIVVQKYILIAVYATLGVKFSNELLLHGTFLSLTVLCGREFVEGFYHGFGICEWHHRTDGQTQLFVMNALGYGQVEELKCLVTFLLMRGNGIVDEGFYAALAEVVLQGIALLASDGEEVVNVTLGFGLFGQEDVWVLNVLPIIRGNALACSNSLVKMAQFHV